MKHGNCTAIVLGTGIIIIAVNNFLAINDNFWKNRHNVATSADSNAPPRLAPLLLASAAYQILVAES